MQLQHTFVILASACVVRAAALTRAGSLNHLDRTSSQLSRAVQLEEEAIVPATAHPRAQDFEETPISFEWTKPPDTYHVFSTPEYKRFRAEFTIGWERSWQKQVEASYTWKHFSNLPAGVSIYHGDDALAAEETRIVIDGFEERPQTDNPETIGEYLGAKYVEQFQYWGEGGSEWAARLTRNLMSKKEWWEWGISHDRSVLAEIDQLSDP